jgi:chromosome segregation ATPase
MTDEELKALEDRINTMAENMGGLLKKVEGLDNLQSKRGNEIGDTRKKMDTIETSYKQVMDVLDQAKGEQDISAIQKKIMEDVQKELDQRLKVNDNSSNDGGMSVKDGDPSAGAWSLEDDIGKLTPEQRKIANDTYEAATKEARAELSDEGKAKEFLSGVRAAAPAPMENPFAEPQSAAASVSSSLAQLLNQSTQKNNAMPATTIGRARTPGIQPQPDDGGQIIVKHQGGGIPDAVNPAVAASKQG